MSQLGFCSAKAEGRTVTGFGLASPRANAVLVSFGTSGDKISEKAQLSKKV